MATVQLKPTSPGQRTRKKSDYAEITASKPLKALASGKRRISGRNHKGRITIRHRGGAHKRRYREIDFRRNKDGVPAKVASIEYDPNRTARIALLHYYDGEKRYIIAQTGVRVGDVLSSGPEAEIRAGNCLPLRAIPLGTVISCIEMKPGKGAQMARSAGAQAVLAAKAGASFISPFVGRLDDMGLRGLDLIEDIVEIYAQYDNFETEVLVASIRGPGHVVESALAGAHVVTLPPNVLRQLYQHPLTDKGLAAFMKDWDATGQSILEQANDRKNAAE